MSESLFVQTVGDGKNVVVEVRDGKNARQLARGYVHTSGILSVVRTVFGWPVKWLARSLYFSPALGFAYAVTSGHIAALIAAIFVGLVVAFFVALILYVIVAFIAFGEKQKSGLDRPRVSLEVEPSAETDARDPGSLVTVKGRVVRLHDKDVVVADAWQRAERTTYADVFAVVREDGLPIVVLPTTAPTLNAPNDPNANALVAEKGLFGDIALVCEGDVVTLRGVILDRIANVNAFELDGEVLRIGGTEPSEAMPYREVQLDAGLLVSDTPDVPLQIHVDKRPPRALASKT